VATISKADHATTEGWVTVKSRRKSSKQSSCSLKGKEVAVSELGLDVNTPVTHSSPICIGTVRPLSPPRPDPLVVPSCAGDVRVPCPPSVEPLVLERLAIPLLPEITFWMLILVILLWLEILKELLHWLCLPGVGSEPVIRRIVIVVEGLPLLPLHFHDHIQLEHQGTQQSPEAA